MNEFIPALNFFFLVPRCGKWDFISLTRDQIQARALEVQIHWIAREVPPPIPDIVASTLLLVVSRLVVSSSLWPHRLDCQASLSFTISQSLLGRMSIRSVMSSNHLILSPSSLAALNLSQHSGLFQWVGSSNQLAKVLQLQLQHQSFQWMFKVDFL